ncbi:MAG: NAD(P)-binding domain-containing protein [Synergistaceae bacterium]|jgi:pyrroline-5-carboxylate reductase|nr:NAD(P)-binding domain-containing protein [Synergistaceae bacterium]
MNKNSLLEDFYGATIGIIGFGHLGHSLAVPLVRNGLPKERLMISHRGSEATRNHAVKLGLESCLTDTPVLMSRADIIIVATRPQDVLSLPGDVVKPGSLVISCMAGLPIDLLKTIFRGDVRRMMCSGPDTILEGRGVATMYPADPRTDDVLRLMGMRIFGSSFEEELDSFTVGICIPAILLNMRLDEDDVKSAILGMERRYPVYGALRGWIEEVTPPDLALDTDDRRANLENVSTKGGITQAMTSVLLEGGSFGAALRRGMERGQEITDAIRAEIMTSSKRAV